MNETSDWFKCTPWSKPGVLRNYKYKGYIIEYIEQSCFNKLSPRVQGAKRW